MLWLILLEVKMSDSAFGFKKPEDSPGFMLWQTTITWQREIKRALDPYDISHAQFVIMAMIKWFEEHQQDSTQIEIATLSKLDKMTVSNGLKKLVALGLVTRKEHEKDTRAKAMNLTTQGKVLITKLIPIVEGVDRDFFCTLADSEQKSLLRLMVKLN